MIGTRVREALLTRVPPVAQLNPQRWQVAKERFQFQSLRELSHRVVSHILPPTSPVKDQVRHLLEAQHFVPAGNTLTAGRYTLRPNCSTLGSPSPSEFPRVQEVSFFCATTLLFFCA